MTAPERAATGGEDETDASVVIRRWKEAATQAVYAGEAAVELWRITHTALLAARADAAWATR